MVGTPVPKAAIYENRNFLSRKNDVWPYVALDSLDLTMNPKPQTHSVQRTP